MDLRRFTEIFMLPSKIDKIIETQANKKRTLYLKLWDNSRRFMDVPV